MNKPSENDLMLQIQQGEQQAFRYLVASYLPALHRFATRLLGDPAIAEDMVQETFLKVWHNAGQWQAGKAKLTTWLHNIAHNTCVDWLRQNKGETLALADVEESELPANADTLQRLEVSEQINVALQSLPERQRSAVVLCYYQGLSGREAADILGISLSALESLLARGRRALKQKLREV